jgi:uncharacterized protein (TIGR03067 family)
MLLAAPVLGDDRSKEDLDQHQGTWVLVSEEFDGKATPQLEAEGTTRVVEGNRVTRRAGGVTGRSILHLDSSKQPKQYDAEIVEGPGKRMVVRGIYAFDGDRLKMCADLTGKARPTEFATSPGSGLSLQVWRRTKP